MMTNSLQAAIALLCATLGAACSPGRPQTSSAREGIPAALSSMHRLSTGARLDPAGRSIGVGNMPLGALAARDGRFLVLSLGGWREQGLEVVDVTRGAVVQRLPQAGAFLGLAWSADGTTLYASGGATDEVYVYAWHGGDHASATLIDSIGLRNDTTSAVGSRYPAGIAVSRDGRTLYVAENLSDSLAIVDVATRRVVRRVGTGLYPYAVAVGADERVYVSDWGAWTVHVYRPIADAHSLIAERPIDVGRHPSAIVLNADGTRLFVTSASTDRVAAVDTRARRVVRWLLDPPQASVREGSTPNAVALSADGTRLFVAEADANAVAVFNLSALSSGSAKATGNDSLTGRVPTEWYPTAVLTSGDSLWVVNGKGRGSGPNLNGPQPNIPLARVDPRGYSLGQLDGTVTVLPAAVQPELEALTRRVVQANGWEENESASRFKYPPIEHVVYIIKENRTYDQILGDLREADGDTALVFFPRAVTPNHHALAERFGVYDRFFVNAEVSNQGHPWTTAGYVTDYVEKTTPDIYRLKRPEPDEVGDADDPAIGYLWDAAAREGLWLRNYGEYAEPLPHRSDTASTPLPPVRAVFPSLQPFTSPTFPPFDLTVPDQRRADAWIAELRGYERDGRMPALEIMHLPNDHTAGARPGQCSPRACMADNDLALGRIVEALSRSRFWGSTAVFVLEDDAQDGPDHVDSHRSVLLTVSPWSSGGMHHRFVNTTDVLATVEEILRLPSMSAFDHFGRPLHDIWRDAPDLRPYVALVPAQPLSEVNIAQGPEARRSARLDFSRADRVDDGTLNQILWRAIRGPTQPYPRRRRAPAQALVQAR